jgi:hypothetical protein
MPSSALALGAVAQAKDKFDPEIADRLHIKIARCEVVALRPLRIGIPVRKQKFHVENVAIAPVHIVQPHVLDAELSVIARQIDNAVLAERPVIHVVESAKSAGNTRGIDRNTLGEASAGQQGVSGNDG